MKLVVLTGAGISAESGLATFRDADGLWEGHRPEDVATPEAFAYNRALVQRFYDERRAALERVHPNAAHHALVELEKEFGDDMLLVTQNVDDLHERAGSRRLLHMHGSLRHVRCEECEHRFEHDGPLELEPECPECDTAALRPDIVWFGEFPHGMDDIHEALTEVDVFAAIGTSGVVYPAAGFVDYAHASGAHTFELNLAPTGGGFHTTFAGPATDVVPRWVDHLLGRD
ncbi:NAD-dependent deacylase [Aeromicrobium duanguangcaii]|uniref:NAD-dependent protein deacylase n=1 Tax=Aeromicrobium duanguangcaii TaxID=2968086 RepID=A0ABY5KH57_9ACTN|nr:NAD-dependent deacylase [Aeromicrobium duanguangcaii]MCD9154460.1 NAD-dependent deacylase [Aeromicrobium duanguangcaii]MCL3838208.1 NAD-dependent deacylase [Aeromicrobium duanguangcaii]UUI68482.1 NAD-dependent deacylase [Aeromicrobium duanguangcaii]